MIEMEREATINGDIIKLSKDGKLLCITKPYNSDLLITLQDKEYPGVFSVDLTDENLYYLIDTLYNDIKNSNDESLFYNGIVDYHSDDFDYKTSSRLLITKQQCNYRIVLLQSKTKKDKTNTVIISNNNCRYGENNQLFFKMYENLNNYKIKSRKLEKYGN